MLSGAFRQGGKSQLPRGSRRKAVDWPPGIFSSTFLPLHPFSPKLVLQDRDNGERKTYFRGIITGVDPPHSECTMRAKLTFPVQASFHLEEHWPIRQGDDVVTFEVEEGRLTGVAFVWRLGAGDRPPTLLPLKKGQTGFGGVDFHLTRLSEIEHRVRTLQGLLSLYGMIEVDFERPKLEWIADSPEEELRIEIILSGNPPETEVFKPEIFDFGLVAHAAASVSQVGDMEVALSFLRRGRRDLKEHRYIEAFYNNFFFLETQFAGGLSNQKKIAKKLKNTPVIIQAIELIRKDPVDPPLGFVTEEILQLWDERAMFISRANDVIIDDLVRLRGELHHHSMRRQGAWHPDKGAKFRAPSHVLHDIVYAVAHMVTAPLFDSQENDATVLRSAEEAGAITVLRFEAEGEFPSRNSTRATLDVRTAGTVIDRDMVESADRHFRHLILEHHPISIINRYTITHPHDERVYGRYERIPSPLNSIQKQ